MRSESREICRWPKWALFIAFLITIPVPYFMFVVLGLVPMFFILFLAIQGLIVALPKFTAQGFLMLGVLWAHVVIFGGLLTKKESLAAFSSQFCQDFRGTGNAG